ncbi:MAG: hypothetical protein ABIH72_03305 [archaeon]
MVECFIKKIFENKIDERVHSQFIRFSKGTFEARAVINLHITSKIKVKSTFEYANDFVKLAGELGGGRVIGIIIKKEGNKIVKENIDKPISGNELVDLVSNSYYILADIEGQGFSVKMKKKLPRPSGKGEAKVDDKYCQLEADLKYKDPIKKAFFWDLAECKKARILHKYEITDIIKPKGETDFEKIRTLSKRKGRIIRKIEFDGKIVQKTKDIEL